MYKRQHTYRSAYAPANQADVLRIHLRLMLEEGNSVVHVVHFHLQGGVFIHAADAAGGLESAVVKAHAHKSILCHLAGKHGRIYFVESGPDVYKRQLIASPSELREISLDSILELLPVT